MFEELATFMVKDGYPLKKRQKFLRNTNLTGFLLRLLRSLFKDYKGNELVSIRLKDIRDRIDDEKVGPLVKRIKEVAARSYRYLTPADLPAAILGAVRVRPG